MSIHKPTAMAAAAALCAMIAQPAAASITYITNVTGTVIDANGAQSQFSDGSPNIPQPGPAQIGRTTTDWQVGANATAVNHGTTESNISMGPLPQVSGVGFAQTLVSQATIIYVITLGGTASDPLVPVHLVANGQVTWAENGAATAGFTFADFSNSSNLQTINEEIDQNDAGTRLEGNDSYSIDTTVFLRPSDSYSVVIFTTASADVRNIESTTDFAEAHAVSDPTFTVEGDFASRWTIEGLPVPDATTTPGVPEPAAWMMLIAGFGLAGTSLRRRRALAAA